MLTSQRLPSPRRATRFAALACLLGAAAMLSPAARADQTKKTEPPLHKAFDKAVPQTVEELKAIQSHVTQLVKKVQPAIVNVRAGGGQGSGVIISEDGIVLTAGHVSGTPGKDVTLTLADGRKVKGKTLGVNRGIDSGMIKITDKGKWPFVDLGTSGDLKKGQWCMAIGHPGGMKPGRTAPVRLGRVLAVSPALVQTDCTLVGGDSGGPLFDMHGRVIGIHSRIGPVISYNIHVPADTYKETWDKLVAGESIGGRPIPGLAGGPWMGVEADPDARDCKIDKVQENSPAAKAGIRPQDVIVRMGTQKIATFEDLRNEVARQKVGGTVMVEVRREDQIVTLKLTVGKRPG